ncbi:MAG: zinc-binding dehydrogenase, partial [bacterium]|nr:zinc-binding dehydrogenase [bacterium]
DRFVHRIPEGVEPIEAVFTDPLTNVIYASRIAELKKGESILIVGAGSLGLLLLQYLKLFNPSCVLIVDIIDEKLEIAKILYEGVFTLNPEKDNIFVFSSRINPIGFDLIFDCAGAQEIVTSYLTLLRPGGRVCIVALHTYKREVDLMSIVLRELKILGGHASFYEDHEYALKLIKDKVINTKPLISNIVPLSKLNTDVFNKISGSHRSVKTVVACRK